MKMDWNKFDYLYNKYYDYYLDNADERERYDAIVFDYMMKESEQYRKLVKEYVKIREDYLSSDRECASFERALQDYFNKYDKDYQFYTTRYDFSTDYIGVDIKDNITENIDNKKEIPTYITKDDTDYIPTLRHKVVKKYDRLDYEYFGLDNCIGELLDGRTFWYTDDDIDTLHFANVTYDELHTAIYDVGEDADDDNYITKWDVLWENDAFTRCRDSNLKQQIALETNNLWNPDRYRERIDYRGEEQYYL